MHLSGEVFFGEQKVRTAVDQGDTFVAVSPPEHAPGPVQVVVRLANGSEVNFGSFTYE